jgi:hypothetical protein
VIDTLTVAEANPAQACKQVFYIDEWYIAAVFLASTQTSPLFLLYKFTPGALV